MKFSSRQSAARLGELVVGPFIPAVVMLVLSAVWFAHGHWVFGVGSLAWGLVFGEFGIRGMRKPHKP